MIALTGNASPPPILKKRLLAWKKKVLRWNDAVEHSGTDRQCLCASCLQIQNMCYIDGEQFKRSDIEGINSKVVSRNYRALMSCFGNSTVEMADSTSTSNISELSKGSNPDVVTRRRLGSAFPPFRNLASQVLRARRADD